MLTLELADVSKKYEVNSWVLRSVSITVRPGLYALIGPNGAGKTTLLRLLGGVSAPSSGRILLNGQDISGDYSNYKQNLGYLPQEFGFYPDMTSREFLHYMARLKGIPPSLCPARVEEIAECAGVRLALDTKIGGWSAGQRRRLGIAQALLNDPDILILDEPMVGLDLEEKLFFWNYFYQLSKDRIIMLSSNTLVDFTTFADGVMLLIDGEICFNGHMQELVDLMDGKVWVVSVPAELVPALTGQWMISAIQHAGTISQVKIVSDTIPDIPGVQLTEASVEDAYTYMVRQNALSPKE